MAPSRAQVEAALRGLAGDSELHGARLLAAVAVGSWAEGAWRPGQDVDVRALYALPAASYLGLGSWWDEFELVRRIEPDGFQLDLVAFEMAKVARLVLKGHRLTLAWLTGDRLVDSPVGVELAELARARMAELTEVDPLKPPPRAAPALYAALDELVRTARLNSV